MNEILAFDYHCFYWLNGVLTADWLDVVMPWWRDKTTWAPLYLAAAAWLWWRYRKRAWWLLAVVALTVGLADQVSSELIKKTVQRPRPCREIQLDPPARVLVGCGGGYSFPSSHATNHFALATLLLLTWGRTWGRWRWVLLLWAASIAYGQVYVGVHYPLDVVGGALLGMILGKLGAYLYGWRSHWTEPTFVDSPGRPTA